MKRWPSKPLGEIAKLFGGSTPSRANLEFWNGDIHWVTPTDLPMPDEGISVVTNTKERITQSGLDNSSATIVPKGAVLFSSRATIGKVAVAGMPLTTNQGFANLVPHSEVGSRFLAYALWYHRDDIARLSGSTTFKEVSRSTLRKYRLPVPPLPEQEQIVALLDEADELRKLRVQADHRATALISALFHEMFGDPIANPKGWPAFLMSEVCQTTQGVQIPRSEQVEQATPGYKRYLYISDFLNNDSPKFVKDTFQSKEVSAQDLVVANTGSPGRVFLGKDGILSNNLFKVSFNTSHIQQLYLFHFLSLEAFQEHLKGQMKQGIQTHLGHKTFAIQRLMIPPITLQKEFSQRVTEIRELESKQAVSRNGLNSLFQSLLHRAFNGAL